VGFSFSLKQASGAYLTIGVLRSKKENGNRAQKKKGNGSYFTPSALRSNPAPT
jgi:hypothetical protein